MADSESPRGDARTQVGRSGWSRPGSQVNWPEVAPRSSWLVAADPIIHGTCIHLDARRQHILVAAHHHGEA
jgi:hypothetical protein